jgi:hypothetical protein|tara:strand:+ start:1415 stop:1774 length:360 start_codon:yes stop_codon:yes gene_type:complete
MAQDFERAVAKDSSSDINIGTTARAVFDCDSDDAIVGIRMANVITSQITVDCFVRTAAAGGSDLDVYLIKNAPIPSGSSLELIDGGSKIVLQNGDQLFVKSNTDASLNCYVSFVDAIST